jgi:hypothetical protein
VGDAVPVGQRQGLGNLDRIAQHVHCGQWTAGQPRLQRLALQVLHHQEIHAVLLADVVQGANVRMVQSRHRVRFALKALRELFV